MNKQTLSNGWHLKELSPCAALPAELLAEVSEGRWEDWRTIAHMPAMVHDVLIEQGVIETPWLPGRAEACRWVAERDWVYAIRFAVEDPTGTQTLRLQGVDTIVEVYLNGQRVAQHSDMYLPLEINVTDHLRHDNTLALHFLTVFDPSGDQPRPIRSLPGEPVRLVRRPKTSYSTYLGPHPYYSRVGVYDAVALQSAGQGELTELLAEATVTDDLGQGALQVRAAGRTTLSALTLDVRLVAPEGAVVASVRIPCEVREGAFVGAAELRVQAPPLWWPRGYGAQPLYRAEITLLAGDQALQRERRTVGFRRITMPEPFHFVVNGVPVRLWGGNWVTPDMVTEVWDHARAERLLDLAEQAHFNALRVWGEMNSPRDDFYESADRRGILIWQDMPELPLQPDEVSRRNCRQQAEHLVRRLKHHPSLLMWCGGNEAAQWHSSEFGGPGGEWPGRVPAEQDVGEVCRRLDPARFYLPSSPYFGIDPNDPKVGDTHGYTNMWYIQGYDDLVFASEDTRIAAPNLPSLRRFMAPEDIWPEDYSPVFSRGHRNPWPQSWERYTTSSSWRKTGPVEQFYDATNAEELVYRLGAAEALYYRDTIERQRRGRPGDDPSDRRICGGYLVWKLNDSWPEIYSAKVDYFLEPMIPYYAIRKAYAPVLVSIEVGTYIWLWVVNDSPAPVTGTVTLQLFHMLQNAVHKELTRSVTVAPGRSLQVMRLDQEGIVTLHRDYVLSATLADDQGRVIARSHALLDLERHLAFPPAVLSLRPCEGGVVVTTDHFARSVALTGYAGGDADGDVFGWQFEDNWFDLMPGEEKVVRVLGKHRAGRITARAWYSPHVATLDWRA